MGSSPERSEPGVLRRLQSAGRPQGRDPIQSLAATLSYMQSTWNPRMWPRVVHVRGSTWTPWRSASKGVAKGMVERAGGPLCLPEPGDPTVYRAWPGFGTTFSNLLSNVSPSVVDDGCGGGFNGADNDDVVGVQGCEASL
jgi:hypothetical protein